MDAIAVLQSASYLAHGYCLLWQPWLVALHAVPDLFIFLAYISIPITLTRLLRVRPDLREYAGLISLFAAFVLLCGLTHLVGLLTLWYPIYPVHGIFKAITAIVSVATAISLWPLVPKFASIPSPAQLRSLNTQLRAEVASHEQTLEQLNNAQKSLEARVTDRTTELSETNDRLRLLARETVHRSNNVLAQIQSLAHQCARENDTAENWAKAFDLRVASLARGNEAVLRNPKSLTANIAIVVAEEYNQLDADLRARVNVAGPDIEIRYEAAQQIALLVWELLHQSQINGVLSRGDGDASLEWSLRDGTLSLQWTEDDGATWINNLPATSLPARLLFQSVPHSLGGTAKSLTDPEAGYRLDVALEELQPKDRADPTEQILHAYPRTPSRLAKPVQSE